MARQWSLPAPFAEPAIMTLSMAGILLIWNGLYIDLEILGATNAGIMGVVNTVLAFMNFGPIIAVATSDQENLTSSNKARVCARLLGLNWLAILIANITFMAVASCKCHMDPVSGGGLLYCPVFTAVEIEGEEELPRVNVVTFWIFGAAAFLSFTWQFVCWMRWSAWTMSRRSDRWWQMQEV